MGDVYFTSEHEWIAVADGVGTVGITDYAQSHLGDLVYVELPELGRKLEKGKEAAVIESVKAASEVFAPASGEVVAANTQVVDQPGLVNESPEGEAWLFRLRLADPADLRELMDRAAYRAYCESLG